MIQCGLMRHCLRDALALDTLLSRSRVATFHSQKLHAWNVTIDPLKPPYYNSTHIHGVVERSTIHISFARTNTHKKSHKSLKTSQKEACDQQIPTEAREISPEARGRLRYGFAVCWRP